MVCALLMPTISCPGGGPMTGNIEYAQLRFHTLLVCLFSPNILDYSSRINVCAVPALDKFLQFYRMYS